MDQQRRHDDDDDDDGEAALRQDIHNLRQEIDSIRQEMEENNNLLRQIEETTTRRSEEGGFLSPRSRPAKIPLIMLSFCRRQRHRGWIGCIPGHLIGATRLACGGRQQQCCRSRKRIKAEHDRR